VLPVGGIKEKVLAARRHGINEVILPRQNEKNVREDLNEELKHGLTVHYVDEMDEVLRLALVPATRAGAPNVAPIHEERSRLSLA
jgi:ATP-dependent Lon protease